MTRSYEPLNWRLSRTVKPPQRRFSSTVSSAKIRRPSMTWATPRRTIDAADRPSMRSPARRIDPALTRPRWTGSSPVTARSNVVLPAPLAPSSATIEPSGTANDAPRRATMTSW